MAPSIANFHHVEIDNIGKRKRNSRPPGGETSDIFNYRKQTVVIQPCKVKFHDISNVFSRGSATTQPKVPPVLSIDPKLSTKHRLFGPPDEIARKTVDRMKSSIFSTDKEPKLKAVVSTPDRRNPITGEKCGMMKQLRRHQIQRKKSNPITGEGYESQDEDCTLSSSSSNTSTGSSGSDTPSQKVISAHPSRLHSPIFGKARISPQPTKARWLQDKICGKMA